MTRELLLAAAGGATAEVVVGGGRGHHKHRQHHRCDPAACALGSLGSTACCTGTPNACQKVAKCTVGTNQGRRSRRGCCSSRGTHGWSRNMTAEAGAVRVGAFTTTIGTGGRGSRRMGMGIGTIPAATGWLRRRVTGPKALPA
jgi:hypothetical protein